MKQPTKEEFEILLHELKTATEMHNYYGRITWEIVSLFTFGIFIILTLLADPRFGQLPTIIFGTAALALTLILALLMRRNRKLWTAHIRRAEDIEAYLQKHYLTDLSIPEAIRKSPKTWSEVEKKIPGVPTRHFAAFLVMLLAAVIILMMLWKLGMLSIPSQILAGIIGFVEKWALG